MRATLLLSGLVLLAACGDQSTSDPCVFELELSDVNDQVFVGNTVNLQLDIDANSSNCNADNLNVLWSTSNSMRAEIVSSSRTGASIRARETGIAIIKAWLALTPSVRDSVSLDIDVISDPDL